MVAGMIACPYCEERWRVKGNRERLVRALLARRLREHIVRSHNGEVL